MKQYRAVVCALAIVLALSGCTDSPAASTTASAEVSAAPIAGWRSIPDFPPPPRTNPVLVWTGDEVLVVGGIPGPPCPPNASCIAREFARDGAAYDPVSETWTAFPDAPVGVVSSSVAFVAGTLFITVVEGIEHTRLLSYDTKTSVWATQDMPDGIGRTLVADEGRLLLVVGSDEIGEAEDLILDIATGEWSALPADPLGPSFNRVITPTPYGLILTATPLVDSPGSETPAVVTVARFEEHTQDWTRLPDTGQLSSGNVWMQVGDELITVQLGGADGGKIGNWGRTYPYGGILALPDSTWSPLADAPEPDLGAWLHRSAVSDRFALTDGYVYDHVLETWTAVGSPAAAPTEAGPAVWAEHALLVVGGVDWTQPAGHISEKAWIYVPTMQSDDL